MKQNKVVQMVALAIMGLSFHAMAALPTVGATFSADATVDFTAPLINSHTLDPVLGLRPSSKLTGNPAIATGEVKSSSSSVIGIQPVRISGDTLTDARFMLEGINTKHQFTAYLTQGTSSTGRAPALAGVTDWYNAGTGVDVKYRVRAWDNANVVSDVYPVTINAAIYTP